MSPEAPIAAFLAERLAGRSSDRPLILGLCGSQGSGKSTLALRLAARFPESAILSLDDLYLTRADRARLAREVHPLFATRGVPGTHDIALGIDTIAGVIAGKPTRLPRFDKAVDDRAAMESWPLAPRNCKLLIFEGWCVGARPQGDAALTTPVNTLEAVEDAGCVWRRHVDAALATDYPALFAPLDALVLLMPPDWPTVLRWRTQQEESLRRQGRSEAAIMDSTQLIRFVSHYERLTHHIWQEMPERADLTLVLGADRSVAGSLRSRE